MLIKDEEGKEMILSYLNQGDFIGELGLFEEGGNVAHGYVRKPPVKWLKFRTKISPIDSGKPGHSDASVCTDGASSASHFRESGQLAFLDVTGRIAQTLLNWQNNRML